MAIKYTRKDALELFSTALFAPEDIVEVRPLPAKEKSFWIQAGDFPAQADRMEKLNKDGWNIYLGVVPRKFDGGSKDIDCASGWCVWTDIEKITPAKALTKAEEAGLPHPTVIVNSGHGVHFYWTFKPSS